MTTLKYGDSAAREVSKRIAAPQATVAAIKAVDLRSNGQKMVLTSDGSQWRFSDASALTGDDVLVIAPTNGTGRWLRECGAARLVLPIAFGTADATALLTLQAGTKLHLLDLWWDVTVDWAGGSSSTIGVSSNKSSYSTKGDLLGGAAGSLAAALTAAGTPNFGTIGAGYDTLAKRRIIFKATDTIRHDRITSAFTSGTGNVVLSVSILQNDGA